MLELPEIETLRREVDREVIGKRIKSVEVPGRTAVTRVPKKQFISRLEGAKLTSGGRKGVLLAAVFMLTRRLWMVIGVHTAWNFAEGGIFGASVSGGEAHGILASHFHGPDVLTGGAFGPEASIVAVLICFGTGAAFLWLASKRGHFVRPFWARKVVTDGAT